MVSLRCHPEEMPATNWEEEEHTQEYHDKEEHRQEYHDSDNVNIM